MQADKESRLVYPDRLDEIYAPVAKQMSLVRDRLVETLTDEIRGISDLCEYVSQYRGKMLRPAILLMSGSACGKLSDKHIDFALVIELLHLATLIHDDVIDEAQIRRSRCVVNQLWGNESSVLLGDYLLSQSFDLCNKTGDVTSASKISRTAQQVCRGEILQSLRKNDWRMSEQEYMQIIDMKTASLYQLCCNLGATLAGANEQQISSLEEYGRCIGLAFQIIDDLLDITGDQSQMGKAPGRDLAQGKATLPVICFIENADESAIEEFLQLISHVEGNLFKIKTLLESKGCIVYTQSKVEELVTLAKQQLEVLNDCQAKQSLMQISDFVARRLW